MAEAAALRVAAGRAADPPARRHARDRRPVRLGVPPPPARRPVPGPAPAELDPDGPRGTSALRELLFRYGFLAVFLALIVTFAVTAPSFLSLGNVLALLHAAAPMMVVAGGLALAGLDLGGLDISGVLIAYLSGGVAVLLMTRTGPHPALAVLAAAAAGAALGNARTA